MHIGERIFNFCHPAFDSALYADRHFSRDNIYQIRGDRSSGQVITHLSLLRNSTFTKKEGTPRSLPLAPLAAARLLIWRLFRLILLVFLHVLLHPLLPFGDKLRELGLLVGS